MTAAYPLQWPDHIERAKTREAGRFRTTLAAALQNVEDSLRRFASPGSSSDNPPLRATRLASP